MTAVLAAGSDGTVYSSFPLAEDGNYTFWAYSDAYKAPVSKEDGSEVEEDIYEAYNLGLVSTRLRTAKAEGGTCYCSHWSRAQVASERKAEIPPGHGVRVNGTKYMIVQDLSSAAGAWGYLCRPCTGSLFASCAEQKHTAKIANAEGGVDAHPVTIDKVYVCKGKGEGACVAPAAECLRQCPHRLLLLGCFCCCTRPGCVCERRIRSRRQVGRWNERPGGPARRH